MSEKWVPPAKIEDLYQAVSGNKWSINRPTAGPRAEKDLPRGEAALQLYSLATPNGKKVSILLEELGVAYDAHFISIMDSDQFNSGFVGANPNSKIPAMIDHDFPDGKPLALMESCAIMLHLCEKYNQFLPTDPRLRAECKQWLFWQAAGQGPITGNFGHFMVYAPAGACAARDYGVARYGMDTQRLLDVLERHLAGYGDFQGGSGMRGEGAREYLVGDQYTVADMACYPWVAMLIGTGYDREGQARSFDFLSVEKYSNVMSWADRLKTRPQVQRGCTVCSGGKGKPWLDSAN